MKHLRRLATCLVLFATLPATLAGLLVDVVNPDSPAAAAGMLPGDVILTIAGQEIGNLDDLKRVMGEHQPGERVPVTVRREGGTLELPLTFGERPGGGTSLGVSLKVHVHADGHGTAPNPGTAECLEWIEKTYRVQATRAELGLEPFDGYDTMLACVERDTGGMTSENAVRYCDNVFKVHCFGLDLLNEIAEAQVDRCEAVLAKSLGIRPAQYKSWQTCAEREVFDGYSMKGTTTDEAGCLAAFQDKCGTRLDAGAGAGALSAEQQAFVACCSADGRSDGQCPMIDDGFSRGPCLDRQVCVNRLTNEWLRCRATAR